MNSKKHPLNNFEWDENKRFSNIEKHGIDFEDAAEAFYDPMLIVEDDRKHYGEDRYFALGKLSELIIAVAFTIRNENIRIISVRKANKKEKERYRNAVD